MDRYFIFLENLVFILFYEELDSCNNFKILRWDIDFSKNYKNDIKKQDKFRQIEKSFKIAYEKWKNNRLNFFPMNIKEFLINNYKINHLKVYNSLLKTLPGSKISYQELAILSGFKNNGYARFVGFCMASNIYPLMIPCHRVISKNNKMESFKCSGGVVLKRYLLEVESKNLK